MANTIYLGELSDDLLNNWNGEFDDPYGALKTKVELHMSVGSSWGFDTEDENLTDRKQLDWGSIIWRGDKADIEAFLKAHKAKYNEDYPLDDGVNYGVLVIEEI